MSASAAVALLPSFEQQAQSAHPPVEPPLLPPPSGMLPHRRGLIRGRALTAMLVMSALAYVGVPAGLLVSSSRPAPRFRPAPVSAPAAAPATASVAGGQPGDGITCALIPAAPEGRLLQRAGAASCTPARIEVELLSRSLPGAR